MQLAEVHRKLLPLRVPGVEVIMWPVKLNCLYRAMPRPGLLVLVFTAALLAGCDRGHGLTEERTAFQIGDRTVEIVVTEAEGSGLTYLNLHDDENTSVEAALDVIRREGGRVVELQHTGERHIRFTLGDSLYAFDPNRMFTSAGLRASLDTLGAYSEDAHDAVRTFSEVVLARYDLDAQRTIVTLHNNTDERYSSLSYTAGGDYEIDALFAHINESDPDDFFFMTDADIYNRLRDGGFNVVLQDNARATDDGSLSVYAGQRNLPYVNVEAQHGHFEAQVKMLEFLNHLLRQPPA